MSSSDIISHPSSTISLSSFPIHTFSRTGCAWRCPLFDLDLLPSRWFEFVDECETLSGAWVRRDNAFWADDRKQRSRVIIRSHLELVCADFESCINFSLLWHSVLFAIWKSDKCHFMDYRRKLRRLRTWDLVEFGIEMNTRFRTHPLCHFVDL